MEPTLVAPALILVLFGLLAGGVFVAVALGIAAFAALQMAGAGVPSGAVLAAAMWSSASSWDLTALPMFVLMGEILFRSKMSDDLFYGLAPWVRSVPGRLLHVNVFGCAVFAAVSGSSAATCATIGRIALPELARRGYDQRLAVGSLAGSGTLGLMIPPSLIMIVYAAATDISVARLFVAGVLPGLVLAALFSGYLAAWALGNAEKMPPPEPAMAWREKLASSRRLAPVILLIVGVIGSIYGGLASATEAAAIGVVLAAIIARAQGSLDRAALAQAILGATRTSAMIVFILCGAAFLTVAMGYTGLPRELAAAVGSLHLASWQLLAALTVLFVVLGCFLDGISMVVLTASVIMPLIEQAGFDLYWFGIYLVVVVEMAQITPPVGFNLFVLQGITGLDIFAIARMALPYFLLMCAMVALLWAAPGIALWLPATMLDR
jgi:tripartite ATP-independent transporter DctM subunit